ncbi:MAG: NADH-quinone oxidoreductase subunit J [Candidatus Omnitrophica bacterium]|nr:NADH-quinone oxidoreductase subunit J [Candidatus Omnitrophota bacterium]
MQLDWFIIFSLVTASLWTVMTRSLLRSGIGLALTSVILAIFMFRLNSPLAAVFELSVCAGLISVLFISTISLTHPLSAQEKIQHMWVRLARFWFLPLLVIVLVVGLLLMRSRPQIHMPLAQDLKDARVVLWNFRQIDLLGQAIVLLAGVFGVVVLFKERQKK